MTNIDRASASNHSAPPRTSGLERPRGRRHSASSCGLPALYSVPALLARRAFAPAGRQGATRPRPATARRSRPRPARRPPRRAAASSRGPAAGRNARRASRLELADRPAGNGCGCFVVASGGRISVAPELVVPASQRPDLSARQHAGVDAALIAVAANDEHEPGGPATCREQPPLLYEQTLIAARNDFFGALPRVTVMKARARSLIVDPRAWPASTRKRCTNGACGRS